ncbi:MAG: glycosyltransferase family 29 protein [Gammaproteobacteria bacterium]|nr:glycosyltransferase family 29 protein [Gammaproteobacteria bacterium]
MGREKKVIVIGNGASVLERRLGRVVDEFEIVVRINNFRTDSYESHVGSKTSIWARNQMRNIEKRRTDEFEAIWICLPGWVLRGEYSLIWQYRRRFREETVESLRKRYAGCEVVSAETVTSLERRMGADCEKKCWPSTGLIAIEYAIRRYGSVWIYGFDHFARVQGHPRHYFGGLAKMRGHRPHHGELERAYIRSRIEDGSLERLEDVY